MDARYERSEEALDSREFNQEEVSENKPASLNLDATEGEQEHRDIPAKLPDILPSPSLDFDLSSFISSDSTPLNMDKVNKRASNVQKLAEENEKLKAELKAMTDRLEAAERRRERLQKKDQKEQHIMEPSST